MHTSLATDAHFISTAPNAWSTAQQTWLRTAPVWTATYATFVLAHEPLTRRGHLQVLRRSIALWQRASGGVTLRLYGHTHEYRHLTSYGANVVVDGNAGAPLDGSGTYYGFAIVDQETDGSITFTAYQVGNPPTVVESWSVNANGTAH